MINLKVVIKVNPLASVVSSAITAGRKLTGPTLKAKGRLISSTQTSAPIGSDNRPICGSGDFEVKVLIAPATRPMATALEMFGFTINSVITYMVMTQLGETPAKLGLTIRMIEPMASRSAAMATQRYLPPCDATWTISTGLLISIVDSSFFLWLKIYKPLATTICRDEGLTRGTTLLGSCEPDLVTVRAMFHADTCFP